mmetsp:Transcript_23448/g.51012  ORF Transcript_23448/g.51012 Transcript_23448/m.51012 type:complete len:139 (+) Transcript_23448:2-418(+)
MNPATFYGNPGMMYAPPMFPAPMKQEKGPVGANLFVFNFPRSFTDFDLYNAFAPFGNVISSTVFIDRQTGRSKCFGFVSFDNPESAAKAIEKMHGGLLGGKTIKVQLKREGSTSEDLEQDAGEPSGSKASEQNIKAGE